MMMKRKIFKTYLFLFLVIINKIKTEKFSCKKIFPSSYKVFNYTESSENIITKQISIKIKNKKINFKNDNKIFTKINNKITKKIYTEINNKIKNKIYTKITKKINKKINTKIFKKINTKINNKIYTIKIKEGQIKTKICGLIKIPNKCNMQGNAKLLYIPDKLITSNNKCIIIKDSQKWTYKTNLDNNLKSEQQSLIIKNDNKNEEIELEYFFQCNKMLKNKKPKINVIFENDLKRIRVDIESYEGCAVLLSGFIVLEENNFLSGIIFSIFGIFFLFFGRKFQNKFPSIFRSILLMSFSFFFYFTFIESYFEEITRIYFLLGLLVFVTGFSFLIVSYKTFSLLLLGVFSSLELNILCILPFLLINPIFSELLFKIFLFFLFLGIHGVIFIKNRIMFKILTTSFLGSIFILYSLQYFDIFQIEFFFILQNNFFFDVNLDYLNNLLVIIIFISIFTLGICTQNYSRYLEKKKFDGSGYHKIDLNF